MDSADTETNPTVDTDMSETTGVPGPVKSRFTKKMKIGIGIFVFLLVAAILIVVFTLPAEAPPPVPPKVDYSYTTYENKGACVVSKDDNTPITCGAGIQKQVREYKDGQHGGEKLDPSKIETTRYIPCSLPNGCPVDGYYKEYENVGGCMSKEDNSKPITCGPGTQKREATYVPGINGGKDPLKGTKLPVWADCKLPDCIPIDGTYTPYKRTGPCMKSKTDSTVVTCGNAVQKQIREYVPPKYGGKEISPELRQLEDYASCELDVCPPATDATCSEWSYGNNICECSSDGTKYQIRQTRVYTPPVNGGAEVKDLTCKTELSRTILCDSKLPDPPANSTPNGRCPVQSVFVKFPEKNEKLCTPAYGPNRKQMLSATYTFPIGGNPHHSYINDGFTQEQINSIQNLTQGQSINLYNSVEKLDVIFKRLNSTQPEQYSLSKNMPCDVVPWHTENEINNMWNAETGCSNKINDALTVVGKKMIDLQNTEKGTDIKPLFGKFKFSELMKTFNKEYIDICYGSDIQDEKSKFMIINRNNQFNGNSDILESAKPLPSIIPQLIHFNNEAGDVIVLSNSSYALYFRMNGELVLMAPSKETIIMSHKTGKNLKFLKNGNLVITDINNTIVASTDTAGNENSYLHLSENGTFALIDIVNKKIIKQFVGFEAIDFLTAGAIFTNPYYGTVILKNMDYSFNFQSDGNLVLYNKNTPVWQSNTRGTKYLVMHDDSHLIMYKNSIHHDNIEWKSGTVGYGGFNLYLTASGYLIFKKPGETSITAKEFVLHSVKDAKGAYPNKIYPGTLFTNTRFDKVILRNGIYTLRMQMDGNLILNGGDSSWTTNLYNFNEGGGLSTLVMHDDGHLIQHKNLGKDGERVWATNTPGNNGGCLHLTHYGYLVMRNSNNNIIKIFYPIGSLDEWCLGESGLVKSKILDHLKNNFYNYSSWTLFTNRVGHTRKATWGKLDGEFNTNDGMFEDGPRNSLNKNRFNGFFVHDTSNWNEKGPYGSAHYEVDLLNIGGYNNKLENSGDANLDEANNYWSDDNIKEFGRNCDKAIKPRQLEGGGDNANYIPGYDRVSFVTNNSDGGNLKFLVLNRKGKWNYGFVLYKKKGNRDDFANDIYNNNKQLVRKLKEHFCNDNRKALDNL